MAFSNKSYASVAAGNWTSPGPITWGRMNMRAWIWIKLEKWLQCVLIWLTGEDGVLRCRPWPAFAFSFDRVRQAMKDACVLSAVISVHNEVTDVCGCLFKYNHLLSPRSWFISNIFFSLWRSYLNWNFKCLLCTVWILCFTASMWPYVLIT